jgi:hypothetical protein
MNDFAEILLALSEAPDSQIDETICLKLKAQAYLLDFDPMFMLKLLDECANGALASDFAMQAMHFVFEDMCRKKGLDSLEILKNRVGPNEALYGGM